MQLVIALAGVPLGTETRHELLQQEVPFAHPLPHYPVSKKPNLASTFADKKEVSQGCVSCVMKVDPKPNHITHAITLQTPPPHVPAFLPAFPDKHT